MAGLLDAGLVTPRTKLDVPSQLRRQDRPDQRLVPPRRDPADPGRRAREVLQHRHRAGRGQVRRRPAARATSTGSGSGGAPTSGSAARPRASCPTPACGPRQTGDRIAFGQSVSVNALQMIAAVNTIANGGVRISPSLIHGSATTDDGAKVGTDIATEEQVVSTEAARKTARMMERVIDPEAGVAPRAAVPGYRVAGKTGTAQRVGDECGCYDGTFTVSFAGLRAGRRPAAHGVRRGAEPAQRRRRRLGGRTGVREADELRPAPLPGPADRDAGLAAAGRVVIRAR